MTSILARVTAAIQTAGVSVAGVGGDPANKVTWTVNPASLQSAAQPTIDAFNPADPEHETAEQTAQVDALLDQERIFSALVWAIIDTYSAPATVAKYTAARTKIVTAYKNRPWVVP